MARFLDMDRSSLEEMEEDLNQIFDDMDFMIKHVGNIHWRTKEMLESMRYRLATYLEPICCVCAESPARYVNDAWYCGKCVEVEK